MTSLTSMGQSPTQVLPDRTPSWTHPKGKGQGVESWKDEAQVRALIMIKATR